MPARQLELALNYGIGNGSQLLTGSFVLEGHECSMHASSRADQCT
jgi:hypothetical protein